MTTTKTARLTLKDKRVRKSKSKAQPEPMFTETKSETVKPAKPAKAKKPEPKIFREGSKRRACYDALTRAEGCTVAQAEKFLVWAPRICASEFREVAKF